MHIQSFNIEDLSALPELQPETWPDIIPVFAFYCTSSFCNPVKIVLNNHIVGIGTTIVHADVTWLAHIIVHPAYRNKGIGAYITQALIKSIDNRICKTIYLIATDLGAPVYKKLGFETETEYLFYKQLKAVTSNAISPSILPYTHSFREQVQSIDQRISSEDRMLHLENHLSDAFVYVSNNRVEGYYLPQFNEGLLISTTYRAGIELMQLRLTQKETSVFPIDNTDALTYMNNLGYVPFKTAERMRLGEIRNVDFAKIYNRSSGSIG